MKNKMIVLASSLLMLFAFTAIPVTAENVSASVEVSIVDCDNCSKEGCTGCSAKKEGEAKKECTAGEKKACCSHGEKASKGEAKSETKTEEKKK